MLKMAVAALLVSLPAFAEWEPPTTAEWAVLGTAGGLMTLDVMQTSDCLYHHDRVPAGALPGTIVPTRCHENNPLLGRYPSRLRLWGSMAGGLALMSAVFYALPPRWRLILPATVGAVEIGFIAHNASNGMSLAFRF